MIMSVVDCQFIESWVVVEGMVVVLVGEADGKGVFMTMSSMSASTRAAASSLMSVRRGRPASSYVTSTSG